MPGFNVYTSNNLDALFDEMALKLNSPGSSIFRPELITVQSRGMRRWLSLKSADKFGISAGYEFLFPNDLISRLFTEALKFEGSGAAAERYIDKERDLWGLMELIESSKGAAGFEEISGYLDRAGGGIRLYQLASKLIDLFDQYITYRPEMIEQWDAGKDNCWQASLWRGLTSGKTGEHPPALRKKFFKMIKSGNAEKCAALPPRIFIFGIPVLPAFHTETLMALAELSEVNMYFLNPSPLYWGGIKSYREARRLIAAGGGADPADLHIDTGNPLLASMGRLLRDYTEYLLDRGIEYTDPVLFSEPEGATLLSMVQRDIHDLRDGSSAVDRRRVDENFLSGGRSLTVHSCHGKLREVEVLRDFLLDMFNNDSSLRPSDVAVISPDIEEFASCVHAVFGGAASPAKIPYDLVDRKLVSEDETVRAFMALFTMAKGRCTAPDVIDLLEHSPVRAAFDISQSSFMTMKEWAADLNVRWGLDPADREHHGFGGFEANTWRAGLERLVLGYAAPDIPGADFAGVSPFGGIEGGMARSAGALLEFIAALSEWINFTRGTRGPGEWADGIIPLLDRLIGLRSSPGGPGREAVLRAVESLRSESSLPLEGRVVEAFFEEYLAGGSAPGEFITGSVVFCSLLPMRSIPFRVICLIGMNDKAFPRINRTPEFDLMADTPRAGDRSLRDEDRFLFLETIISARDALYISYTGQSISDNSSIPPSVVVSELLDYIDSAFRNKNDQRFAAEAVTTVHKLQPFSPAYFTAGSSLYSFSEENLTASIASDRERVLSPFFIEGTGRAEIPAEVSLAEIRSFMRGPSKYFLSRIAGISLYTAGVQLQPDEPFDLTPIEKSAIGSRLVDELLKGGVPEIIYSRASRDGLLPQAAAGRALFDGILNEARNLADRVALRKGDAPVSRIEGAADCGALTVKGSVDLHTGGLLIYRFSKKRNERLLEGWVDHLFANMLASPVESIFEFKDASVIMKALDKDEAVRYFRDIAVLYAEGHGRPVEFFPEASYAFCETLHKGKGADAAYAAAQLKWDGDSNNGYSGDGSDPWNALAFRDRSPFDGGFADISRKICLPLIESIE